MIEKTASILYILNSSAVLQVSVPLPNFAPPLYRAARYGYSHLGYVGMHKACEIHLLAWTRPMVFPFIMAGEALLERMAPRMVAMALSTGGTPISPPQAF